MISAQWKRDPFRWTVEYFKEIGSTLYYFIYSFIRFREHYSRQLVTSQRIHNVTHFFYIDVFKGYVENELSLEQLLGIILRYTNEISLGLKIWTILREEIYLKLQKTKISWTATSLRGLVREKITYFWILNKDISKM